MIRIGVHIKFVLMMTALSLMAVSLLLAYQLAVTSELIEVRGTVPQKSGESARSDIIMPDELLSRSRTEYRLEEVRSRMVTASLLVGVFISASGGLLGIVLFKRALRRILGSMKGIESDNVRSLITGKGRDELDILSASLASLASELSRSKEEISRLRLDKAVHSEKMASIGVLATTVAHEIKNPLAGISGALQVLAEDFPEESPRKEIANEILDEIERLDGAVKDLLVFARPPELNLIPADINAIIDKTVSSLEAQGTEMNVSIRKTPAPPLEITIDPDQFEKALRNISLYCLHFVGNGGTLFLSSHNDSNSGKAEVQVVAEGKERLDIDLDNMFKPFFSTKRSGSGLGLAISKNIIEGHKGTIAVEDRKGSGFTFRLIFPGRG